MVKYVATRVAMIIPVLLIVSTGTFLLIELIPGDPAVAVLGPNGTPEDYERIRTEMGLDEPLITRYVEWLSDIVLRQDLGSSLVPPVEPVTDRLARAFPVNVELALLALAIAIAVSLPLGILSAYKQGSVLDRLVTTASFGLISIPSFLAGIVLILLFAIQWGIFPLGPWQRPTEAGWAANLHHAILPAITLALAEIGTFARLVRNDMIDTLQQDYVLSARAKGMGTLHVLIREALRPSSFSLLTLAGVNLGRLIGGTVIIEALFSLPGLGRVIVEGALTSDYTLVQGAVLIVALSYVLVNLVVDLLYYVLDPRVQR